MPSPIDLALLRDPGLWVPGKKPIHRVRIDGEHPLSHGLIAFVLTGNAPYEVVQQRALQINSGATVQAGNTDFAGTSNNAIILPSSYMDNVVDEFTVSQKYSRRTSTNQWSGPSGQFNAGATKRIWNMHSSAFALYVAAVENESVDVEHEVPTTDPFPDGTNKHTVGAMWKIETSGNGGMYIYVDGALKASKVDGLVSKTFVQSTLDVHIGNASENSSGDALDGVVDWWAFWDRELSEKEHMLIHIDPYQMLTPA